MILSDFKWYRKWLGGVWEQVKWYDSKGKLYKEWRRQHNGKWCEYKEITENHL